MQTDSALVRDTTSPDLIGSQAMTKSGPGGLGIFNMLWFVNLVRTKDPGTSCQKSVLAAWAFVVTNTNQPKELVNLPEGRGQAKGAMSFVAPHTRTPSLRLYAAACRHR